MVKVVEKTEKSREIKGLREVGFEHALSKGQLNILEEEKMSKISLKQRGQSSEVTEKRPG